LTNEWIQKWDDRYRTGQQVHDQPARLVARFADGLVPDLIPGDALDLACGPGRNALYLADRGWHVTAIDGSTVAIDLLLARAGERSLSIDARIADLEGVEFQLQPDAYDLVLSSYYFQRSLISGIQQALRSGGMVIVIAHVSDPNQPEVHPIFARPGELRALFDGWQILHYREGEPDESGHRHAVAELVARKPD
jgi:tellurite methyltransferase